MKKKVCLLILILGVLVLAGCGSSEKRDNLSLKFDDPQKIEIYEANDFRNPSIVVTDKKVLDDICQLIQSAELEPGGEIGEGGFHVKVVCESEEYEFSYAADGISYKDEHYQITNGVSLLPILQMAGSANGLFLFKEPKKIELYDSENTDKPKVIVEDSKVAQDVCDYIRTVGLERGGEIDEGGFTLKIKCEDKTYEIKCAEKGIEYEGVHYKIINGVDLTKVVNMLDAE